MARAAGQNSACSCYQKIKQQKKGKKTMTKNTLEARIPFDGFYHGYSNYLLEDAEERLNEGQDTELSYDWQKACNAIAEAYTEAFEDLLSEWTQKPIKLKLIKLTSPQYYNFDTDKIYASISEDDLKYLYSVIDLAVLSDTFKDLFTSRSGFISFYANEVPQKPVTDWDHNELFALITALCEQYDPDYARNIYYTLADNESGYVAVLNAIIE